MKKLSDAAKFAKNSVSRLELGRLKNRNLFVGQQSENLSFNKPAYAEERECNRFDDENLCRELNWQNKQEQSAEHADAADFVNDVADPFLLGVAFAKCEKK